MVRGEVWWANTASGDRPVLVMSRDPVADRIGAVVVATCTRTIRELRSELRLGKRDGMPDECVATFDNLYTLRRTSFRSRITTLSADLMDDACQALRHALACL